MFRMNVCDLHVAFLTKDNSKGAEFEEPTKVAGTMQIQLAPRVASAPLYGDGKIRHQEDISDGYNVTLDHNKIPPHMLARMKGQKYEGKVRRSNAKDSGVYFALGWAVDLTGEQKEMTWLLKCKLAPSNKNMQQKTDNINYSTDTFTITAIPLEYNGDYEFIGDTTDETSKFTLEDAEKWFDEVPVLPPKSPSEDESSMSEE